MKTPTAPAFDANDETDRAALDSLADRATFETFRVAFETLAPGSGLSSDRRVARFLLGEATVSVPGSERAITILVTSEADERDGRSVVGFRVEVSAASRGGTDPESALSFALRLADDARRAATVATFLRGAAPSLPVAFLRGVSKFGCPAV